MYKASGNTNCDHLLVQTARVVLFGFWNSMTFHELFHDFSKFFMTYMWQFSYIFFPKNYLDCHLIVFYFAPKKNWLDYLFCTINIIFHDFPWPTPKFHDFPGLENKIIKFYDFPGFPWPVRALTALTVFFYVNRARWQVTVIIRASTMADSLSISYQSCWDVCHWFLLFHCSTLTMPIRAIRKTFVLPM